MRRRRRSADSIRRFSPTHEIIAVMEYLPRINGNRSRMAIFAKYLIIITLRRREDANAQDWIYRNRAFEHSLLLFTTAPRRSILMSYIDIMIRKRKEQHFSPFLWGYFMEMMIAPLYSTLDGYIEIRELLSPQVITLHYFGQKWHIWALLFSLLQKWRLHCDFYACVVFA